MIAQPIHHADFTIESCVLELRLNGYLLVTVGAEQRYNIAPPVNFYLAGRTNLLEATLRPFVAPDGRRTTLKTAEMRGSVRAFAPGEMVGLGEGGEILTELTIPSDMRDRALRDELDLPITLTATFANTGPDFSARLVDAQPVSDREALLDYGMRLRDLFARGDADAIMKEQAPRIADHALAYYHPLPQVDAFREHLVTDLLANHPHTDFERDDLELVSHAGDRLWEIRQKGGGELFITDATDDGAYVLRVFSGLVDGELKIVR